MFRAVGKVTFFIGNNLFLIVQEMVNIQSDRKLYLKKNSQLVIKFSLSSAKCKKITKCVKFFSMVYN